MRGERIQMIKDLYKEGYTQNREISWLHFDNRCLNEAKDKTVPLIERMKFVEIYTSNLTEFFMVRVGGLTDMTGGLGSNGLGSLADGAGKITGESILAGLLVEFILTFIFVMTILGVTSKKFKHGSFGGLIIGLTLTFVHIFGIGLTGTSVNPARSLGPAILAWLNNGDMGPLNVVWVFVVGPFVGAMLAAIIYKALASGKKAK